MDELRNRELVSVIVVSYNSEKYIEKTLNSILHQTYKNLELIISDDHSDDKSIKIAEEWISKNGNRFVRCQIVKSNKNTGITPNCNRGVRASEGVYYKLIAADDILAPSCIEKLYNGIVEQGGEIAFCYEYVFLSENEEKLSDEAYLGTLEVRPSAIGIYKCSQLSMYKRILQNNQFPAPTSFIKRSVYEKLGGYDESYLYIDDYTFWLTALRNNIKFVFVETKGVFYRRDECAISWRDKDIMSPTQIKFQQELSKLNREIREPEMIRLGLKNVPKSNEKHQITNRSPWSMKIQALVHYGLELKIPWIFCMCIGCLSPKFILGAIGRALKSVMERYVIKVIPEDSKLFLSWEELKSYKYDLVVRGESMKKSDVFKLYLKIKKQQRQYKNHKKGEKIRIVVAIHLKSTFSAVESIYLKMLECMKLDVTLLVIPGKQPGMDRMFGYDNGIIEYMENKKYNYILGYENGNWKSIFDFDPDIVVFQTPYHRQRPVIYSYINASAFPDLIYTPYGPWVMDKSVEDYISVGIDKAYFDRCWKIFVDKLTYELLEYAAPEYIDRTVLSGSPKVDFHINSMVEEKYCWPRCEGMKKIIWLPRWGFLQDRTSFLDYYQYFLQLCETRTDICLTLRPHPLMFRDLIRSKICNANKVEEIKQLFNNGITTILDEKYDYREGILSCDFIVADFTSIIYEYLPTNKPIVYCKKDSTLVDSRIMSACYVVENEQQLKKTMIMLLDGKDPLYERRQIIIDELNYFPQGIENGKVIANYIVDKY